MRNVTVALLAVALSAGCGSPGQPASVASEAETGAASVSTATNTTIPGERPVAEPDQGLSPSDDSEPRLSIEDALLADDALSAPWELQWRQLDAVGYGAGPNQTDCDEYWAYEGLLTGEGGHVMWWADGGNANHRVFRIGNQAELPTRLSSIASIAESCPIVTWNEGGSFTTELFAPDLEALIMRFVDDASGEVTWVAITVGGDLISVLQVPLWTRADGTMLNVTDADIAELATEMARQLQKAGPERRPPPTTTNPKLPTIVAPPPPDIPTIVAPPPPVIPTTTVALDSLGQLLLMNGEVGDGWELLGIERSTPGGSDDSFVDACPAARSLDDIDDVLVWEASFRTPAQREALQLIGDTDDPATAVALVRRFAEVAQCDLSALVPGAVGSGGAVEIAGAEAASTLFIESPDLPGSRLELGAAAIGSIVVVFTIDAESDAAAPGEQMLDFIARAVAKVVAVRS